MFLPEIGGDPEDSLCLQTCEVSQDLPEMGMITAVQLVFDQNERTIEWVVCHNIGSCYQAMLPALISRWDGKAMKGREAAITSPCPSARPSNAVLPVIADGNTSPRLKKASASMLPDAKPSSAKPTSSESTCSLEKSTSAMFVAQTQSTGAASDALIKFSLSVIRYSTYVIGGRGKASGSDCARISASPGA